MIPTDCLHTWKGSWDSLPHVACTRSRSETVRCLSCDRRSPCPEQARGLAEPAMPPEAQGGPGPRAHLLSICGALRSLTCVTFRRRAPCWISANSALRPLGSAFLEPEASVNTCEGARGCDYNHKQHLQISPRPCPLQGYLPCSLPDLCALPCATPKAHLTLILGVYLQDLAGTYLLYCSHPSPWGLGIDSFSCSKSLKS